MSKIWIHKFLLLLWILIIHTGCSDLKKFSRLNSDEKNLTTVSIPRPTINGLHTTALNSGLMIYAMSADDSMQRGAKLFPDEQSILSWTIPSGRMIFFGIGWAGGVGGTMYCGKTDPILLDGSAKTIHFVMDDAFCLSPPFGEPIHGASFQPFPILLVNCSIDVNPLTPPGDCTGNIGPANEMRVDVPEFMSFNRSLTIPDQVPSVSSACLDVTTGGHVPMTIKVPTGTFAAGPTPFTVRVRAYDSAGNCSANLPPTRTYYFHRGAALGYDGASSRLYKHDGTNFPASPNFVKPISDLGSNFFIFLRGY